MTTANALTALELLLQSAENGARLYGTRGVRGQTLSVMVGRRYARIVGSVGGGRHALAFVDLQTGEIYAADSWKGPRLNFSRGNVFQAVAS